jgi:hypothetical protein
VEPSKKFLLRINPELWKELETWARDELRSVNGQIEYILKQAVTKRKRGLKDSSVTQQNEQQG